MYMHIDDGRYKLARVGVAVCDTVDGNYEFLKSFRPLGDESRDIGQFVDDDGTAYLIFEDRPNGSHIAKLSADYLTVAEDTHLFPKAEGGALEGGALVHYNGLYYVVGSQLSGWSPNSNKYATAANLRGLVGLQGYRAAGAEDVRFAIEHAAEGRWKQDDQRDFHRGHLEAAGPMGLALSLDAIGHRRREAGPSRAETVDHRRRYR